MHLVEVLRGRAAERISKSERDKPAVFGIGPDFDEPAWCGILRQLVALRYARPDREPHGALSSPR